MPGRRVLWTGPYAADLRGRAVEAGWDGLWIVATAMARDDWVEDLTRRRSEVSRPRVLCWDDLWAELAREHANPPAQLSPAAARSALIEAIERTRAADRLGPLDAVADLPGMRQVLRARFASWTRAERSRSGPPPRPDAVIAAEWAVYRAYRTILKSAHAEDPAGLAVWASKTLRDGSLGSPESVAIIDPVAPSAARERVILQWAAARAAPAVLVTLPTSGAPDGDDPAIAPLRSKLVDLGFEEEGFAIRPGASLATLESTLFDDDLPPRSLRPVAGLSIVGGPEGEGLGLLLANEIARRIEAGAAPDDLLVLVRHWDDDAARAVEILRSWGIPATSSGRQRLACEPAVAALRLALAVAAEGWEVRTLLRLLRNGLLAPGWGPRGRRKALDDGAATIQALRVFRGRAAIERALDDRPGHATDSARALMGVLVPALDSLAEPAAWSEQARRLRRLGTTLGLDAEPPGRAALDALADALDDHAALLDEPDRAVDLDAFARAVAAITDELHAPARPARPGCVRVTTVDEAEGVRARVILVTNLAEGTFPARGTVRPAPDDEEGDFGEPLPFAVERLRFLRILGAARDEVVLLAPTTDAHGQDVLPAGFVDDVRRRLDSTAGTGSLSRLDPVFRDHPELARAPGDRRVLAVARACLDRDVSGLLDLARDPARHDALLGTAAALRLTHDRLRNHAFNEYDGLLGDPALVARVAKAFGPDHAFSATQIESFALCPFQFYQRYVLKIAPMDDRSELSVDHQGRGERLHRSLEEIHAIIASEGPAVDLLGRIEALIESRMAIALDTGDEGNDDVAGGLRAIEDECDRRALDGYRREFIDYRESHGANARVVHFELSFGPDPRGPADESPPITIGGADGLVRLRGKIDRVDLIDGEGGGFRVIDYKTGAAPSGADVTKALRSVQLPLYAIAVEQLLFGGNPPDACDFGYWTVNRDGYKPIKLARNETWPEFRDRVVAEVVRLAASLRAGEFPVKPTRENCDRSCDYKRVCRIGQSRRLGKIVLTRIGPP